MVGFLVDTGTPHLTLPQVLLTSAPGRRRAAVLGSALTRFLSLSASQGSWQRVAGFFIVLRCMILLFFCPSKLQFEFNFCKNVGFQLFRTSLSYFDFFQKIWTKPFAKAWAVRREPLTAWPRMFCS